MRSFILFLLAAPMVAGQTTSAGGLTLVRDGRSEYSIVIAEGAPPAVRRGAEELQRFIEQMSGARLPIGTAAASRMVLVGESPALETLRLEIPLKQLGAEEFVLRTAGPHLVIAGGGQRGSMYGVYTLLDKLGCRWYTATLSRIPKQPTIRIGALNERHRPAFEYREPFYTEATDRDWAARNRMNGYHLKLDATTGGKMEYFPFVHSFDRLVPPEKYFDEHPEYFSLVDGSRRRNGNQLCLTNPEVLRISIESVERWIAEHPDATILSVSQNDGYGACECDNCRRVEREEGGVASGPILRFVNAVAEAIGKKHPDKLIDTLAYAYSEVPPAKVRPRPNVRIRLCKYHTCEAHPFAQCPLNRNFQKNLEAWSRITNQLYVWHYNTNFSHYLMPFPNFDELAADVPAYQKNGVVGLFMQGSLTAGGRSENADLRAYAIARLLWDTSTDVPALVRQFHEAYYEEASGPMMEYFELMHKQVRPQPKGLGSHLWIYNRTDGTHLSDEFLNQAERLFDTASARAKREEVKERVRNARRSIEYVWLMREKKSFVENGQFAPRDIEGLRAGWRAFVAQARKDGITNFTEVEKVDQTVRLFDQYVKPYRALTIANDRLTVHIVPELSGRVTHMIDKRTGRNLMREGDPGTQHYPDVHGGTTSVGPGWMGTGAWKITWSVDDGATEAEVRLTGRTENGLLVRKRIWLEGATLRTDAEVENQSKAPLEAALHSRWDFELDSLDQMRLKYRQRGGEERTEPFFVEGGDSTGRKQLEGAQLPDGTWRVEGAPGSVVVVNRFAPEYVERAVVDWSFRSQNRVALENISPRRTMAPGERIRLRADYTVN